jgi:hypothetical protein
LGDDSLLDLPYSGLSSSMNWESRSSPGLTGMTLRFLKKPQWRFDAGAKHEWGDDGDSSIGQGIHRFFFTIWHPPPVYGHCSVYFMRNMIRLRKWDGTEFQHLRNGGLEAPNMYV